MKNLYTFHDQCIKQLDTVILFGEIEKLTQYSNNIKDLQKQISLTNTSFDNTQRTPTFFICIFFITTIAFIIEFEHIIYVIKLILINLLKKKKQKYNIHKTLH